ncbi:hypothetical protein ACFLV0_00285 [Chloroflexota bacterium]
MKWKTAETKEDTSIIPKSWLHIHYYDALNTLFRIENSLRVFVYLVLKNNLFDKWADISITSDDVETTTIQSIANKRIHQAQDFGYLGYIIQCPVMHLTSGELVRLITDDNYWRYFKQYFPASKQIIKHKLDAISIIRNSLAHFRPIKSDDVDLIKQNASHALQGVDDCLSQVTNCYDTVPTNTKESWYLSLSPLETALCNLQFMQSNNSKWICIKLEYNLPILITHSAKSFSIHNVLTLITPSILGKYGSVKTYVTYITESEASSHKYTPESPNLSKNINFLFNRSELESNYDAIKSEFESLLNSISEETDLIQNDNLARGILVSVVRITARCPDKALQYWEVNAKNTLSPQPENDYPEYWRNTSSISNMLTSTERYPWMPIDISETEWDF